MLKFYVDYNARELLREGVQTIVVGLDQMNSGIPEGQLEVGLKVMLTTKKWNAKRFYVIARPPSGLQISSPGQSDTFPKISGIALQPGKSVHLESNPLSYTGSGGSVWPTFRCRRTRRGFLRRTW